MTILKTLMKRLQKRVLPKDTPQLSSVEAYALWAKSYPAQAHNKLMQIEQTSMLQLMPSMAHKVVLDLACGTGRYGKIAEEAGADYVIGFDNSIDMLKKCILSQTTSASTENIPLADNTVDTIVCGLALGHLPTIDPSLREMSRVLKQGGEMLISDFHPYQFLSGARRTFSVDNTTYQVEHHVHQLSDYFKIGQQYGLVLEAIEEPIYQDDMPVVLVLKFSKT